MVPDLPNDDPWRFIWRPVLLLAALGIAFLLYLFTF